MAVVRQADAGVWGLLERDQTNLPPPEGEPEVWLLAAKALPIGGVEDVHEIVSLPLPHSSQSAPVVIRSQPSEAINDRPGSLGFTLEFVSPRHEGILSQGWNVWHRNPCA